MSENRWKWFFGTSLVALSALLYVLHYFIFYDPHHIFIYFFGDIAFVPVEVLLVTLVIHELLSRRERRELMHRLNMVMGVFYNEIGGVLIRRMQIFLPDLEALRQRFQGMENWTEADYRQAVREVPAQEVDFDLVGRDLTGLRDFLVEKRSILLRFLANPNLLGHDRLTDLLWAVTHVVDELAIRPRVDRLGEGVGQHIANDMARAYRLLLAEWLTYMLHLKKDYPYMYRGAIRAGPFSTETKFPEQN